MKKGWTNKLYLVTLLFFTLGFFNIVFGWMGFACMIIPFIMLAKNRRKSWCQGYCPRMNLFTRMFQGRSLTGKAAPKWLTSGKFKWFVLAYFSINMIILFMSTLMVSFGRVDAIEKVRFLLAFQIPWDIPQLLNIENIPNWAVHLSFRMYSMMFTTTVIGMVLGWIYKPRTWCTICPINTISDIAITPPAKGV
jgi:hypothetical protein